MRFYFVFNLVAHTPYLAEAGQHTEFFSFYYCQLSIAITKKSMQFDGHIYKMPGCRVNSVVMATVSVDMK